MKGRRPFGFLFFTNELKVWYFKYIIGAIIVCMIVTGLAVYSNIDKYTKTIEVLGLNLPGTSNSPVNIARDLLLNARSQIVHILVFETIILIIIGIVASMYFAFRIMGPLRRIEKEINEMVSGTIDIHSITLRKGDYLTPITILMNKLIEVIRKRQDATEELQAELKGIRSFAKQPSDNKPESK